MVLGPQDKPKDAKETKKAKKKERQNAYRAYAKDLAILLARVHVLPTAWFDKHRAAMKEDCPPLKTVPDGSHVEWHALRGTDPPFGVIRESQRPLEWGQWEERKGVVRRPSKCSPRQGWVSGM